MNKKHSVESHTCDDDNELVNIQRFHPSTYFPIRLLLVVSLHQSDPLSDTRDMHFTHSSRYRFVVFKVKLHYFIIYLIILFIDILFDM